MNPAQKTLQNLRVELAQVAERIRHLQPHSPQWREMELKHLELVDELYFQEHLCQEIQHKRDQVYH